MSDLRIESPFPFEKIPLLGEWFEGCRKRMADDFGPQTNQEMVRFVARQILDGTETWSVEIAGDVVGFIYSKRITPILADIYFLFKPEVFGQKTTDVAIRDVFGKLFADGVEKLTTAIFRDNHGVRQLMTRLGMRREGTLIGHTRRDGQLVDLFVLGISKEEFKGCPV